MMLFFKVVPTARRVLENGFYFGGRQHQYLTYESNVPFVLRFMVDHDITGCCWVELPAGSYDLRSDGTHGTLRKESRMQLEADVYHDELIAHEVNFFFFFDS